MDYKAVKVKFLSYMISLVSSMLKQNLGLREDAKVFLSDMEYVDLQLKLAKEVLSKARFAKKKEEKVSYLLVLASIISDCLETLGVKRWENRLK